MLRRILLLEPDEDDSFITQTIFDELKINVTLQVVKSPVELFDHLKLLRTTNAILPSIIMLNYHVLPSGALDIIRKLKADHHFNATPLVVGCGVSDEQIVRSCYAAGVNSFIRKASSVKEMEENIKLFVKYWTQAVLIPD